MKIILLSVFILLGLTRPMAQDITRWKLNDLKEAIANTDRPTVFNFWATFCKPCIEEIPHFQQLVKKYDSAGVRLILVSLDLPEFYPKKISSFANRMKFTAPITYLDETNADLFCPAVDSSWSGAIPASLFINNKTGHRRFFEEPLKPQKFEAELKALIGSQ